MDERQLVEGVMARIGAATEEEARRAIVATLMTLGERMGPADKRLVASELPRDLRDQLMGFVHDPSLDGPAFYARVARRAGVRRGHGLERARAVCGALASSLSPRVRMELSKDVWPERARPVRSEPRASGVRKAGSSSPPVSAANG